MKQKLQSAIENVLGSNGNQDAVIQKLSAELNEVSELHAQAVLDVAKFKTEVATLSEDLAKAKEELSSLSAIKAQIEAQAKADKLNTRFSSLSQHVGDNKAEALKPIVENMSDEQFDTLLSTFKDVSAKEDKEFAEKGSAATIEASEVELDPVKAQVEYAKNKNKSN
jgi:phage shock protein A